jgi:hypothetical protein
MTNPNEAIEVTPEVRKAVYAQDCLDKGHVFDFGKAVASWDHKLDVASSDPDEMPHLTCLRCDKTWLIIEEPGDGYDDAIVKLKKKMKDSDGSDVWDRQERAKNRKDGKVMPRQISEGHPHA